MRYLYMRFWEEDKNSTVSCTPALITAVKKKKKMYKKKKLTMEGAQYLHTADTNVNVCTSLCLLLFSGVSGYLSLETAHICRITLNETDAA